MLPKCVAVLPLLFAILFTVINAGPIENAVKEADGSQDSSSLYKIALKWYEAGDTSRVDAVEVFHQLVEQDAHVMSAVKLGHHYASVVENTQLAIKYFALAGENGPHHASLFNTGRLLAELSDWVGALAYLRAAATLSESYPPEYISDQTTELALEAYDIVSRRIAREELTVVQVADVFVYGSLRDLDEEAQELWTQAIHGLVQFNSTFVASNGKTQSKEAMEVVAVSLRALWEKFGSSGILSELQKYLLLDNMNDMLGPLAGLDDAFLPMAGGYAEALATHSLYCYEHFATTEDESACFNGAAASAMSFYRRAADGVSAKRVLEVAQQHPSAATSWKRMEQTPRVFHAHLESRPWWNAKEFSVVQSLSKAFQESRETILQELEAVKSLQEGRLRGANSDIQTVEVEPNGTVEVNTNNISLGGFQRIFTPYIGVRTEAATTGESGAGGWAEYGPLFDGISWNEQNCKVVPTICNAIRNDPSLCTARADSSVDSTKNVWQLCGADTVVTILRLRPGTTILPHCGTTNARLIMHFALEGADGIDFTVGGETVKNYGGGDGHAIVFDDSFEHSVYHGGRQDRFVVLAVLSHPDLV